MWWWERVMAAVAGFAMWDLVKVGWRFSGARWRAGRRAKGGWADRGLLRSDELAIRLQIRLTGGRRWVVRDGDRQYVTTPGETSDLDVLMGAMKRPNAEWEEAN